MKKQDPLLLKAKTRQEVAEEYGVHRNTLSNQLKKAKLKLSKGILMPKDVEKIYETLGWPDQKGDKSRT